MIKTLNIALLGVTLIAGAAHSEGDYYVGASKQASSIGTSEIDAISTSSIEAGSNREVRRRTSRDDRKMGDD